MARVVLLASILSACFSIVGASTSQGKVFSLVTIGPGIRVGSEFRLALAKGRQAKRSHQVV